jgi:hypothetical protein
MSNVETPQTDLSRELRAYNANGNAIGAERMMARAADAIDALVEALALVAGTNPHLNSGVRAVMDMALLKTEI